MKARPEFILWLARLTNCTAAVPKFCPAYALLLRVTPRSLPLHGR